MNRKKKISIWSPLRYTNYGDDLQAIIFGLYIKSLGWDVKLFQLDEELSSLYDLEIASTVNELCKDINLCIIAGGALLTPVMLHKRILHKVSYLYEQDFKDLVQAIKKYNTKFCALSIGGDGNTRIPFLYFSRHRIRFFKSDNFLNGTVRLEGDVSQMEKFGKSFKYFPDYLL